MNLLQMLSSTQKWVPERNVTKRRGGGQEANSRRRRVEMIERYRKAFMDLGGKASRPAVVAHLGLSNHAWQQFKLLEELGHIRRAGEYNDGCHGTPGIVWEWVE